MKGSTGLLARIRRSLSRDRDADLPIAHVIAKVARYVVATGSAPIHLRACDAVGDHARTTGRPVVENLGRIRIGTHLNMNSTFAPVVLATGPGGELDIGDDVHVNFGARISAASRVTLGDGVRLGPYVRIVDDGPGGDGAAARPIAIGKNVWLGARVTVEGGAVIGDGTVVVAGSTVTGALPAGVIAGGAPARVISRVVPGGEAAAAAATPAAAKQPETTATADAAPAPKAAPKIDLRGTVIGDFSLQELADQLAKTDPHGPHLGAEVAPFGQVVQALHALAEGDATDFAVVWTRPEFVGAFGALLRGEQVALDRLLAEVDDFAAHVKRAASRVRFVFVPTWVLPPHRRGLGTIDLRPGGTAHAVQHMNLRLAAALEGAKNVFLLDAQRWLAAAGARAHAPKLWYMAKVHLGAGVFEEAAADVRAGLRAVRGGAKKLIVLDLDDTLWGGIVGDAGWQNLKLGGHNAVGESFVDFQRELKALSRRGIALAIVSKNEESVAIEAIKSHPEMVLTMEDVSAYRINWNDKARNVAEIAQELNLGLQSVVFIDDNPVERARVREALPEVFVPEWPEDKLLYVSTLLSLRCFDVPSITQEDLDRTKQYAAERQREELKTNVGSIDDWLLGLGIKVTLARLDASNLTRATQLLNKTNQMNLSTRRLGETELSAWAADPKNELWVASVSDKFGDAGLTGILGLRFDGGATEVVDYVLSCRVMGRKVEEALVAVAVARGRAAGTREIVAQYKQTPKNKPCFTFWGKSGFAWDEPASTFRWATSAAYPIPRCIEIAGAAADVGAIVAHSGEVRTAAGEAAHAAASTEEDQRVA